MSTKRQRSRWLARLLVALVGSVAMAVGGQTAHGQTPNGQKPQAAPNFSGTWELVGISNYLDNKDPKFPKMTLVIEQASDQLRITEKRIKQGKEEVRTFVYNTGGQGDSNTSRVEVWRTGSPIFESVTRIDKNRIVTEFKTELGLVTGTSRTSTHRPPYKPGDNSTQRKDEWSLDGSGNTLTLVMHANSIQSSNMIGVTLPPNDAENLPAPRTDFSNSKLKFRRI